MNSKRFSLSLLVIVFPFFCLLRPVSAASYAVSKLPTPVFSTPHIAALFGANGEKALRLDTCGQMRELEFVALPGTVFLIEETRDDETHRVYRVTTADYPYPTTKGYYIDSRLVAVMAARPVERIKLLPQKEEIISALLAAEGSRYVWGGNLRQGLPELLRLYPPPPGPFLTEELLARWQFRGVDCSGLLYEATGGYTPRNTSALISFGKGVSVAGLTAAEISRKVEPLDLIVWNGHVMIILDRERVIESRLDCGEEKGVMVSRLEVALARVIQRRVPVDEYGEAVAEGKQKFVVRRWYDLSR